MFLWLKAFHIIAVVCWFACLFYLPRLFVYHSMTTDQTGRERFQLMERKLYRAIGNPSMWVSVVLGVWLAVQQWAYLQNTLWFWVKIATVAGLVGYHYYCGVIIKQFARQECHKGHVFFRWFNEVPALALILIVIMVVVKPG